ncbi:MAG: 4Fe-4S binding protein [Actinomycetota bacterium]|nr:4Fe-4S binding protein [Actinomycetota bacterium]
MKRDGRGKAHWIRRGIQALFLAAFIALAWASAYPPSGRFPESFFLRMDPLAAFSAVSASGVWLYLIPAWILLGLTLLSGRFFCGWICPLGSVLEWLPSLGNRRRKSLEGMRPADLAGRPIGKGEVRIRLKYVFLAALLLLFVVGINLLWIFDPLVIANRAVLFAISGVVPVLFIALLILAVLVGPRYWCQELCPLGAGLSLVSMAGSRLPEYCSPLALVKDKDACIRCGACARACPFEIIEVADSERSGRLALADCALCGECVTACPVEGALSLRSMGMEILGSSDGKAARGNPEEAVI